MASVKNQSRSKQLDKAIDGAKRSMFTGMGFFVQVQPHAKDIEQSAVEMQQSVQKLGDVLLKYLDLHEPIKRQPQEVVREDTLDQNISKVRKGAFDLAKLGLIIPFLLNKDAREYMASFLSGLTGFSLEGMKTTLIAVTGVLTGMFALKLFKQINDTIEAIKKLNDVTRTLFGITEITSQDIDSAKDDLDKEKSKINKDKERRRNRRRAKVERARKLRSIISNGSKIAKVSVIGAPVAILVSSAINTLLDYNEQEDAVLESEDEGESAPEPETVWSLITKNIIESLTFGLLSKENINNTLKVFKGDEKVIAQNRAAVSGMSVSGAEFGSMEGAGPGVPVPLTAAKSETRPPTASISPSIEPPAGISVSPATTQSIPSIEPISSDTSSFVQSSEEVVSEKRVSKPPVIIINNIDNTTLVAGTSNAQ